MKLALYDWMLATGSEGAELADERDFRRSTRGILIAAGLMKKIFAAQPALRTLADARRLGFVVGSSVGEIDVTRDFLKELAVSQTARPFLFQLSSHNSTAGFLAQHFSLRGPVLTVSSQYQSAESALESSHLLLQSGQCDAVLLLCMDQIIADWMDLKMYAAYPQLQPVSGAALAVLGRGPQPNFTVRATVADLSYGQKTADPPHAENFYDSNTLESVLTQIERGERGLWRCVRPDQTLTELTIDAGV